MDEASHKNSSTDQASMSHGDKNIDDLPEQEIKKLKNRHSTQLSRKRRKLYEDLLEEKYNDLNNQYKNEIQKLNLNNSLSDKMKKYISFLRQKKVIESKMEESIAIRGFLLLSNTITIPILCSSKINPLSGNFFNIILLVLVDDHLYLNTHLVDIVSWSVTTKQK